MIEFIDKTATADGTLINRKRLMGVQGYEAETVTFSGNTITKVTEDGTETTTFSGNTITKVFTGEKTITKQITFNNNGYISEVI